MRCNEHTFPIQGTRLRHGARIMTCRKSHYKLSCRRSVEGREQAGLSLLSSSHHVDKNSPCVYVASAVPWQQCCITVETQLYICWWLWLMWLQLVVGVCCAARAPVISSMNVQSVDIVFVCCSCPCCWTNSCMFKRMLILFIDCFPDFVNHDMAINGLEL